MIRLLGEGDAEAYAAFRRASLVESPLSFSSSPADDVAADVGRTRERLRQAPDSVILGAFDPDLAGAVGLRRDEHAKAAHKAHVWGMYVVPERRGRGIGARLIEAAIAHARGLPGIASIHLSVSATALAAQRLYERAGFEAWGTEPDALRHGGRSVDEHYLVLRIR